VSSARSGNRLPNWAIGLIVVVIVLFGFYLAFTKKLPFTSNGYEVKGVFHDAQNVAVNSPVREAGVNVGTVTSVDPLPQSNAAVITMSIKDEGRPIHDDARLQLRPRLFLEGNLFVDVHPGSPSAPEMRSGSEIPIQQTSNSVQLDQILTNVLQSDVRGNLQLALGSIGDAFEKYGGAQGLRQIYSKGGPAYKNTALVNEALLGTRAHDLSGLVRNFDLVASALDRNRPQLESLVTNLRTVTGSFAAQDTALAQAIHVLPATEFAARPVFADLNNSFPFLRAFAREALPGVRSSGPTLTVATPFIYQLRKLVSKPELRGLVHDLRPTVPQLARLTIAQIPFMEQARALSSCFNHVIIPWSNDAITANDNPAAGVSQVGKVYQEAGYALAGIASESRSGDANGQYIRAGLGAGPNTLIGPSVPGLGATFAQTLFPLTGTAPSMDSSAKTPFKPTVPCETQQAPNLSSTIGPALRSSPTPTSTSILHEPSANSQVQELSRRYTTMYENYLHAQSLEAQGNTLAANRLMRQATQGNQAFTAKDFALYQDLVHKLTGARIPQPVSTGGGK
jgi:phospholipid/cholesterol/gamma-HCH transport system substrate-binding protein